ncbi:MAG: hypothetical protein H7Y17_06880, partial [Chlorobia bacterium]|nr:hypothetical protein [Fimbriimonadaceae bacterium]
MIGILTCVVLSQSAQYMTADEINRRLEATIDYRTDPVRLPVALDDIGSRVGVRIRCEAELQPAVVVVGVRNKPAKEIIQHLMDGIGAGSFIRAGTLHVGIRIATDAQTAKQLELERKAIQSTLDNKVKTLGLYTPIDPLLASRTVAQALTLIQLTSVEGRYYPSRLYESVGKCPVARAVGNILATVGPELLQHNGDDAKVIDMRSLSPAQAKEMLQVLSNFETEQNAWAKEFEPILK